jgi:glyoxylate reductase
MKSSSAPCLHLYVIYVIPEQVCPLSCSIFYVGLQTNSKTGYDKIDVAACTARGIVVTNAPTAVTDATADLTTWLILGALRQLYRSISTLHRGEFNKGITLGHCPSGKVLGIIGFGRIGSAIKKRVEAFGMRVQYFNNLPVTAEQAGGATSVSFDELLASSDVISLHVPLNKETHHLISRKEIAKMKTGVVLVNASRGPVIDEAAMAEALDEGKIAAVGLDVYEQEPIIHPKLLANDGALLVPHMGTQTVESTRKKEVEGMENARRAVLGMDLLSVVFEQQGKLPLEKSRDEEERGQYSGCQTQM